jgi:tetratricopeptide (TPR) repeat protein
MPHGGRKNLHRAPAQAAHRSDFDWRGAEAEYRRALVLAPNDAGAKFFFARLQASFGELEAAIDLTRQALTIDPLRANWHAWLAIYLSGLNHLDEAERAPGCPLRGDDFR